MLPRGCENWFILVNTPPISENFDWRHEVRAYRNLILDTLARVGLDVRQRIRSEQILTLRR